MASCFDPGRGKYMPSVAALWTDFFASLTQGARVLDVCTGNGALIYIAQDVRGDLALTGIDKAAIDPAAYVRAADASRADFRGKVDASALPFEDGAYQAVVSQYGIEYAPRPDALKEAIRVLAPGGSFRVLTHAAEGDVASGAPGQLSQTEALLKGDLFETARTAFSAMKRGAPQMQTRIKAFQKAGNLLLQDAQKNPPSDILLNNLSVLNHAWQVASQVDEQTLLVKVDELQAETQAHDFRSRALVQAALSRAEANDWAGLLQAAGLEGVAVSEAIIPDPDRHIGWIIEGVRG